MSSGLGHFDLPQDGPGDALLVAAVADAVGGRVAEVRDVPPQNADAKRVESGDFRLFGQFLSQERGRPLLHFVGRLVGKGDREDAIGRDAVADQFGDAEGDHPSLARAGPRQDQQRPGKRLDGFFLRRVEVHGMDRKAGRGAVKGGSLRSQAHSVCRLPGAASHDFLSEAGSIWRTAHGVFLMPDTLLDPS